ncbi:uncharacterized protein METZ01_LOCUS483376, partial [marine metagenome]
IASIRAERKSIIGAAKKLLPMSKAEKFILENPDGTAGDYKKLPPFMFNELYNNNIMANAFINNGSANIDLLMDSGKIIYESGLKDYDFTTLRQLRIDIKEEIQKRIDPTNNKSLKKIDASLWLIERNFQIISNLHHHGLIDQQRPLYFNPVMKPIIAGDPERGNDKLIVPFEFVGKKLFYGLTAAGTHDLNPMPFDKRYPMVGLHANALNTILSGRLINKSSKLLNVGLILLIGVILAFAV